MSAQYSQSRELTLESPEQSKQYPQLGSLFGISNKKGDCSEVDTQMLGVGTPNTHLRGYGPLLSQKV